jgi:hypothetical protein
MPRLPWLWLCWWLMTSKSVAARSSSIPYLWSSLYITRVVHLLLSFHWDDRSCLPSIRDSCAESTSVVTSKTSAALPGIILPACSSYRDIVPGKRSEARNDDPSIDISPGVLSDLDTPSWRVLIPRGSCRGVWLQCWSPRLRSNKWRQFQSTCRYLGNFWQRNSGSEVDQTTQTAFIALYNTTG